MDNIPREEKSAESIYPRLSLNKKQRLKLNFRIVPNSEKIEKVQKRTKNLHVKNSLFDVEYCANKDDIDFIDRYLRNNPKFKKKHGHAAIQLYETILDRIWKEWRFLQLRLIYDYYGTENLAENTIVQLKAEIFGECLEDDNLSSTASENETEITNPCFIMKAQRKCAENKGEINNEYKNDKDCEDSSSQPFKNHRNLKKNSFRVKQNEHGLSTYRDSDGVTSDKEKSSQILKPTKNEEILEITKLGPSKDPSFRQNIKELKTNHGNSPGNISQIASYKLESDSINKQKNSLNSLIDFSDDLFNLQSTQLLHEKNPIKDLKNMNSKTETSSDLSIVHSSEQIISHKNADLCKSGAMKNTLTFKETIFSFLKRSLSAEFISKNNQKTVKNGNHETESLALKNNPDPHQENKNAIKNSLITSSEYLKGSSITKNDIESNQKKQIEIQTYSKDKNLQDDLYVGFPFFSSLGLNCCENEQVKRDVDELIGLPQQNFIILYNKIETRYRISNKQITKYLGFRQIDPFIFRWKIPLNTVHLFLTNPTNQDIYLCKNASKSNSVHPKFKRELADFNYKKELICDVCSFPETSFNNLIMTCNGCLCHFHQECYGVPNIDKYCNIADLKKQFFFLDKLWFCRKCILFSGISPKCKYCPISGNAFKQVYKAKRWGHIICAKFIESLGLSNIVFMEPIEESIDDKKEKRLLGLTPKDTPILKAHTRPWNQHFINESLGIKKCSNNRKLVLSQELQKNESKRRIGDSKPLSIVEKQANFKDNRFTNVYEKNCRQNNLWEKTERKTTEKISNLSTKINNSKPILYRKDNISTENLLRNQDFFYQKFSQNETINDKNKQVISIDSVNSNQIHNKTNTKQNVPITTNNCDQNAKKDSLKEFSLQNTQDGDILKNDISREKVFNQEKKLLSRKNGVVAQNKHLSSCNLYSFSNHKEPLALLNVTKNQKTLQFDGKTDDILENKKIGMGKYLNSPYRISLDHFYSTERYKNYSLGKFTTRVSNTVYNSKQNTRDPMKISKKNTSNYQKDVKISNQKTSKLSIKNNKKETGPLKNDQPEKPTISRDFVKYSSPNPQEMPSDAFSASIIESLMCFVCKVWVGRTTKCCYDQCDIKYHVTCGINAKYYFDMENQKTYCKQHDPRKNAYDRCISLSSIHILENLIDNPSRFLKYPQITKTVAIHKNTSIKTSKISYLLKIKNLRPRVNHYMINRIISSDLCYFDSDLIEYTMQVAFFFNITANKFYETNGLFNLMYQDWISWDNSRSVFCISKYNQKLLSCENFRSGSLQIIFTKNPHEIDRIMKDRVLNYCENPANYSTYKTISDKICYENNIQINEDNGMISSSNQDSVTEISKNHVKSELFSNKYNQKNKIGHSLTFKDESQNFLENKPIIAMKSKNEQLDEICKDQSDLNSNSITNNFDMIFSTKSPNILNKCNQKSFEANCDDLSQNDPTLSPKENENKIKSDRINCFSNISRNIIIPCCTKNVYNIEKVFSKCIHRNLHGFYCDKSKNENTIKMNILKHNFHNGFHVTILEIGESKTILKISQGCLNQSNFQKKDVFKCIYTSLYNIFQIDSYDSKNSGALDFLSKLLISLLERVSSTKYRNCLENEIFSLLDLISGFQTTYKSMLSNNKPMDGFLDEKKSKEKHNRDFHRPKSLDGETITTSARKNITNAEQSLLSFNAVTMCQKLPCFSKHIKTIDYQTLKDISHIFRILRTIFNLNFQKFSLSIELLEIEKEYNSADENYEVYYMEKIIEKLLGVRDFDIFKEKVTEEIAPSYFSIITNPMCLDDISEKIHTVSYSFKQMREDLSIISENCRIYNASISYYVGLANKFDATVKRIFQEIDWI